MYIYILFKMIIDRYMHASIYVYIMQSVVSKYKLDLDESAAGPPMLLGLVCKGLMICKLAQTGTGFPVSCLPPLAVP